MSPNVTNAVSGAPKGKGGTAEAARPIQDLTMLKVAEAPEVMDGFVPCIEGTPFNGRK